MFSFEGAAVLAIIAAVFIFLAAIGNLKILKIKLKKPTRIFFGIFGFILLLVFLYGIELIPNPFKNDTPTSTPPVELTDIPTVTLEDNQGEVTKQEILVTETFSNEILDPIIWDKSICYKIDEEPTGRTLQYKVDKDSKENTRWCMRPLKIDDFLVEKVSFQVTLNDGMENRSFAGLFTTCGQDVFDYYVSRTDVAYRYGAHTKDREPVHEYVKSLPIIFTLTITWDMENQVILLEIFEENGLTLAGNPIPPIDCSDPPEYLSFGVRTQEGQHINAEIDQVKVWGTER